MSNTQIPSSSIHKLTEWFTSHASWDIVKEVAKEVIKPIIPAGLFSLGLTWVAHTALTTALGVLLMVLGLYGLALSAGFIPRNQKTPLDKTQQLEHLKRQLKHAQFLWSNRSESGSPFWAQSYQRWFNTTVNNLADYWGIERSAAEQRFSDTSGMEQNASSIEYLRRNIDILRMIIYSSPSS